MAELAIAVGLVMLVIHLVTGPRTIRNGIEGAQVLAGKREDLSQPDSVPGCGGLLAQLVMVVGGGLFLLFLLAGGGG